MQHLPLHPLRRSLITAAAFMAVSAVMLTAHSYLVLIDFVLAYYALAIVIAAVLGRRYAAAVAVAAPAASVLLVQMTGVGPHFGTGAAYARGAVIAVFSALALYAMPRWLTGADEFRRLAQTLRERTQTLETLETLERSAPVAIVTLDRDGAVTSWNPAAEQISGWQEAEVLGRRITDVSRESAPVITRMLGEVLGKGASFQQVEAKRTRKDGQWVHVSVSAAPLRDAGGAVSGAVIVAADVTAPKAVDEALRARTQTLETLARSAPVAIITVDRDGLATSWNRAAEEIFGWQEAEVLGRRLTDVSPENGVAEPRILGEALAAGVAFQQVEAKRITKDGRWLDVSVSIAPLRDAGGDVSGAVIVLADVTERKAADYALRRADEFRASVMESTTDAIFAMDMDRRITLVNKRACEITGYTREELLGQRPGLFSSPEVDGIGRERFWRVVESRQPGPANERLIIRKDGGHRIVRVSLTPLVEGDEVSGIVGTAEDVTERKAAGEALRRADELRASVMESTTDGIFAVDLERRFTMVNRRVCEITGFTQEELLGQTPALLTSAEVDERGRARFQGVVESAQSADVHESQIIRKDGERRIVRVTLTPLVDDGKVTGLVGTAEDVTERRAADDAVRRGDEFRARVMESANEGIFAMDLDRRFVLLNRRACEISGYTREELLGQTPALFYSPETDERAVAQFLQVVESGQPMPGYELGMIRKGGAPGIVRVSLTPLVDDGKVAGVVGVVEDVTERKRLEEQVLQSQKMESIGRLAGGIAHDFNNLTTAIIGYADLSLAALDPGDPVAADVRDIREAADRAANLAHQLLAFSRRQMIEPRVVDINELIVGAHSMLKRLIGEHINVVMQAAPDLRPVRVDPTQFTQVVVNLAVNARDAMPAGGTLTLATANVETDGRGAAELPGAAGSYVRLTITDTGAGMPADVLEHVFEPFFTTKETGKGTGLGLATCYGIVKQAGGHIAGCSEPGAGSAFAVYLPAVAEPLTALAEPDAPGLPRGPETILLAEDELPLQKLVSRVLLKLGYTLLVAADGSEALRISEQHRGPIDLLIADVVMPGMNGMELAERVTQQRPSVRVLLTSGYAGDELRSDVAAQAASFLSKPFSPQVLARRVREALDARADARENRQQRTGALRARTNSREQTTEG